MSDIQQKIQEDKTKFPKDYSESVDWYTELATSAPVTAGEMIVNLRARVQELERALVEIQDRATDNWWFAQIALAGSKRGDDE